MSHKIIIIGAGPTGLGAAYKLKQLGIDDFQIFEQNDYVGGLAASFKDENGFIWDIGGHVIFSENQEVIDLLDKVLKNDSIYHLRESWIRLLNLWIPYPFQNNIRYLPEEILWKCVEGLLACQQDKSIPENFKTWIESTFGKGISDYFMLPYNKKIWSFPLHEMSFDWISQRVSVPSLHRILKNIILNQDDMSWGLNNKFRFPLYGGTGQIFRNMVPSFKDQLFLNKKVCSIDPVSRKIFFEDHSNASYDYLINTGPLDLLITSLKGDFSNLRNASRKLKYNNVGIIGIGINRKDANPKCWMYFPEKDYLFYRVTNFSKYSPNNVPDIKDQFSLMTEFAYQNNQILSETQLTEKTIQNLIQSGLMKQEDTLKIATKFFLDVKRAYPIPTLERNQILETILPELEHLNIFSRGRFGAWKYETGNMDHSLMQGFQVVDRIMNHKKETILYGS